MAYKITPEQMTNLQAALAAWNSVAPGSVFLDSWRLRLKRNTDPELLDTPSCGSLACFGGWLPHFPHFQALGVQVSSSGAPALLGTRKSGRDVSVQLFGWDLFGGRGSGFSHKAHRGPLLATLDSYFHDNADDTDHGVVKFRLETAIKESFA